MVSSSLTLKIIGICLMEVFSVGFGVLPFAPKLREGRATALGEAFSGGVFLTASVLDLLPDAFDDYNNYLEDNNKDTDDAFAYPALMAIVGFLASLLITRLARYLHEQSIQKVERGFSLRTALLMIVGFATASPIGVGVGIGLSEIGNDLVVALLTGLAAGTFLYVAVEVIFGVFGGHGHTHEVPLAENKSKAVLLFVMLSFHSVIEGLALGIQSNFADTAVIFIAIMCHKAVEAFSIGVNVVACTEMRRTKGIRRDSEEQPFMMERGSVALEVSKRHSHHNGTVAVRGNSATLADEEHASKLSHANGATNGTPRKSVDKTLEEPMLAATGNGVHHSGGDDELVVKAHSHSHGDISEFEATAAVLVGVVLFIVIAIFT